MNISRLLINLRKIFYLLAGFVLFSCESGLSSNGEDNGIYYWRTTLTLEVVDRLVAEGLSEFTDTEQAARAQFEMMNFRTLVETYPTSKAAGVVRGRCDNYYDYNLELL